MIERENWPYLLVLAIGIVTWVLNDVVDRLREVPVLDYTLASEVIQEDGEAKTQIQFLLSNIGAWQKITDFHIVITSERQELQRCDVRLVGRLIPLVERNESCAGNRLDAVITTLFPGTSINALLVFGGTAESQPSFRLDVASTAPAFKLVNRRSLTSFALRNFSLILLSAVIVATLLLIVGVIVNISSLRTKRKGADGNLVWVFGRGSSVEFGASQSQTGGGAE